MSINNTTEKTDLLNRKQFVADMISIISKLPTNKQCSFAVNGVWGCGKSTMLEMFEDVAKKEYLVVNYNAWRNDFYDEPLVAILSTLIEKLNEIKERDVNKSAAVKIALESATSSPPQHTTQKGGSLWNIKNCTLHGGLAFATTWNS